MAKTNAQKRAQKKWRKNNRKTWTAELSFPVNDAIESQRNDLFLSRKEYLFMAWHAIRAMKPDQLDIEFVRRQAAEMGQTRTPQKVKE